MFLAPDEEGNVKSLYTLTVPDTSYLKIPDQGLVVNLNSEFVQGYEPGIKDGNLAVLPITTGLVKDGAITREKLAPSVLAQLGGKTTVVTGEFTGDPNDITVVLAGAGLSGGGDNGSLTLNAVVGDGLSTSGDEINLVLDSGSGLQNGSGGVSLIKTCANHQLLKWNGSAWICGNDNGGGGGSLTVQESDSTPIVTPTDTLEFASANFVVTDQGGGAALVTLASSVLTASNYSSTLDSVYVNTAESPAAGDVSGNFQSGLTVAANSVALATDTTGNFVNTVSTGVGLTVSGVGVENATASLNLDILTTGATASTSSNSGIELGSDGLRLLGGCAGGQILKWNGSAWACAADSDTVSGTFSDSSFIIQDNSDPTKQLLFELFGVSSGTTRTLSVPNASGTIITTGNLTDISINASQITAGTLGVARGGTGNTSFNTNGVVYGNGTGALQSTTAGSNGQVLVGQTGTNPQFVTVGGDASISSVTGALTIELDAVALGADTTGNYVSNITTGNGLTVSGVGSENATALISVVTQANKGLENDSNGLSLIDCGSGQVLKYNLSAQWACDNDTTGTSSLQQAYDTGGSIQTADNKDILITLINTTTDSIFDVDIQADNYVNISRNNNGITEVPGQLIQLENLDTDITIPNGIIIEQANGGVITDAIDVSDADLVNAINIGQNDILSNGVSIGFDELNLLDSHDAPLVDTNDAVTTAITGVGTLTAGTWQATAVGAQYGGTGIDSSAGTGIATVSGGVWSIVASLIDSQISDTLTASIFVGSGSTTNAVDLATAEVAGTLGDGNVSNTLTIGASSTVDDAALSANVTKLGSAIDLATSEVSGFLLATNLQDTATDLGAADVNINFGNTNGAFNTNITTDGTITATTFIGGVTGNADTATALANNPNDCASDTFAHTIAANGDLTCSTVSKTALANSGTLGFSWGDSEVSDTLTIGASSTVADGALSSNVTKLGATITKDELTGTGTLGFSWSDSEVSNTLTSSIFVGSGSTTDAIDLATAEVAGTLGDGNVSDTLTIGASSTVADGALSSNVTKLGATITKDELTGTGTLGFTWSDSEVSDTLTSSLFVGSGSTTTAIDLATAEVAGFLLATNLQDSATDLGAADVNINFGNTNGAFNTNITTDGTITATTFIGGVTGNASTATALATDPSDCATDQYANAIAANGNLACAGITEAQVSGVITDVTAGTGLTGGGASGNVTVNVGAGNGISVAADSISLALQANKGLEVDGNGLSLIDCSSDQVLKYNGSNQWACATDNSGGVTDGDKGDITVSASGATWTIDAGAVDLVNDVSGNLRATNLQNSATDLGAADVNINFGNTNGAFNTNITTDGTITATTFIGGVTGNADTATALANNPNDCASDTFAHTIAANGDLTCSTVSKTALANSGTLGFSWGDSEVSDTLTIGASSTVADGALSSNVTKLGATITKDELTGTGTLGFSWSDSEVSNTLTSSIFVGSGSTTDAIDLATAEVAGTLGDGNVSDTLTIGASSTVADGALSSNVTKLGATITKDELTGTGTLGFTWSDSEVSDTLTSSLFVGSGSTTTAIDLATAEVAGFLLATNLQDSATDLGAADVNINFGNTNGAFNTNITTDGTITATTFIGGVTGNASTATALATDPSDCATDQYANAIAANGNLACAGITEAQVSGVITDVTAGTGLTGGGASGNVTVNVGAGNGISVAADSISLALQANKGLEVDGNGLSLIDCSSDQVLKYNGSNQWACATDNSGGVTDGDKGDITVSASGATWTIDANSVALGTDTAGDYVASFTAGTGLSGDASGEGSTPTLSINAASGIITSGDNIVLDINYSPTWTADHTWNLSGTEDLDISSDLGGTVDMLALIGTPSATAGSTKGLFIQQADSSNSNGLDEGLTIDNADANLAVPVAIRFQNSGGGNFTEIFDILGTSLNASELSVLDGGITDGDVSDTLTIGASSTINDAALSANVTKLGATITKDELTGTGTLGFSWSDSEVSDTLTIGASSTVADAALSSNVTKLGATITKDEITGTGTLGFSWSDSEVSNTLTSSIFIGSGSTTDAIDLATAEIAGTLGDSNVSDTLTIGASSTVADAALSSNVTKLGATITKDEITGTGTLGFSWSDSEVADDITLNTSTIITGTAGLSVNRTITANSGSTQNVQDIIFGSPVDTSGTNVSQALNITATIGNATGGTNTANIINIGALSGDAEVTLNAINIGNLTATTATETAINSGTGWDRAIQTDSGAWIGSSCVDGRTLTTTQTVTVTCAGLTYDIGNNQGTVNGSANITFNITGVPNVDGAMVFISSWVQKGASTLGQTATTTVQINGTLVGSHATTNVAGASGPFRENYIVVRHNGTWRINGYTPSAGVAAGANSLANADLAEWTEYTGRRPIPGELVVASTGDTKVSLSTKGYQGSIAGVVATNPHTTMGRETEASIKLALAGRIPVIVTTQNGQINEGDAVTTSSISGIGMKATKAGATVGKALSSTANWTLLNCPIVASISDIEWPEDDGTNQNKPCFRVSDAPGLLLYR